MQLITDQRTTVLFQNGPMAISLFTQGQSGPLKWWKGGYDYISADNRSKEKDWVPFPNVLTVICLSAPWESDFKIGNSGLCNILKPAKCTSHQPHCTTDKLSKPSKKAHSYLLSYLLNHYAQKVKPFAPYLNIRSSWLSPDAHTLAFLGNNVFVGLQPWACRKIASKRSAISSVCTFPLLSLLRTNQNNKTSLYLIVLLGANPMSLQYLSVWPSCKPQQILNTSSLHVTATLSDMSSGYKTNDCKRLSVRKWIACPLVTLRAG